MTKIEYRSVAPGPRDHEHRRVAQTTDNRFGADEAYVDWVIAMLVEAINGLGGSVTVPPRSAAPNAGQQIGG